MKKIKTMTDNYRVLFYALTLLAVATTLMFVWQPSVLAVEECGVDSGTSFFECSDSSDNPIQEVFLTIIKNLFLGVGIVCLIGVIFGGIVYSSAGGDSSKTKKGITYVVNSVIGLIIFIGAYTLLSFMVPGDYFDQAGVDGGDGQNTETVPPATGGSTGDSGSTGGSTGDGNAGGGAGGR
ncbi:hypothetical protein EOL73_02300 [Candidatus Saccharibacteria bacterium]|nr:hypothetical protein [Candidatus Saccharibacteria bacterium]NCU40567.1 hypothetical protein [Candidatus Saccharibacteria bacterium]